MSSELPPPGSALRAMIIRGDLTTVGVVLVIGAVVLVGLAVAGVLHVAWLGASAFLLVAGVALVRWARGTWRALLRDVAHTHATGDVGPSPVPWVSDALWRARNAFDPALDAEVLLLAEVDPMIRGFGREDDGAFSEPVLRPVAPDERALATTHAVPDDVAVPPKGDGPSLLEALASTPGRFIAMGPRWPVCCERLTTLVTDRSEHRPEGAFFLAAQAGEDLDPMDPRGLHGFTCRACGRNYATDPAW